MTFKIILVHPYVPMEFQYGSKYRSAGAVLPPLGILYIAGVLEKAGFTVEVLDANARQMDSIAVAQHIRATNPDLLGLTGTTLSFGENIKIATQMKACMPHLPIVIGGVHAQGMAKEILTEETCFDFVIPGEGEYTFLEFAQTFMTGGNVKQVPGVWFCEQGVVKNSGPGRIVEDLDDLPFPARHLLHDMSVYHQKTFCYRVNPHLTMFTQRGCPFKCVFCSSSKQFRETFNSKVRAHSVDYVRREIQHLIDTYGVREICFADDTFNLNRTRTRDLCDMIISNFPNLKWSCNFEVNICDEEMLTHMKKAGCWLIQMGVETGNAEIMKEINKGITLDQVRYVTQLAYRLGMAIKCSFILGNPGDTKETIEETICFAESLEAQYVAFGMMSPLPGSYFWQTADKYGKFDRKAYDKFSMSWPSFVPHGLDPDYLRRKQNEAHKRIYLRPIMIGRHLKLIRSLSDLVRYVKSAITLIG